MKTIVSVLCLGFSCSALAATTEFSYSGYIKLDAMATHYSDGSIDNLASYLPSQTPVESATSESQTRFDATAKTSRLNLKAVSTLNNGEKVTGVLEFDFYNAEGSALTTNADHAGLRHFFLIYKNLTAGQTWTTFMNVSALPEAVDFVGPVEGTVFNRQAQLRYTLNNVQLSLEKNATNTSGLGAGATSAQRLPDMIARYNLNAGAHSFSFAAMARELRAYTPATATTTPSWKDSEMGYGLNAAGVVKLGSMDNLKFSLSYGQIARYVGVAMAADAVRVGSDLKATDVFAGYVAYQHFWTPALRSSLMYSIQAADYADDTVAATLNKEAQSSRINLFYSPDKALDFGVEYSHAQMKKVNDNKGDFDRLQATVKYSF